MSVKNSDAADQNFALSYELVEKGIEAFDPLTSQDQQARLIENLLGHPLMAVAFHRYSDPARPPESRVDRLLYAGFLNAVIRGHAASVTHPRLKMILGITFGE